MDEDRLVESMSSRYDLSELRNERPLLRLDLSPHASFKKILKIYLIKKKN